MALVFFKQSDIEAMDINDIPEEFVNYFESLDDDGKAALIGDRKDLAEVLGFVPENSTRGQSNITQSDDDTSDHVRRERLENDYFEDGSEEDEILEEAVTFDEHTLEQITNNAYEGLNIEKSIKNNMSPFEVLAIGDNTTKCMLHHTPLKEKNIRFQVSNHPTLGVNVKYCKQCKRIYLEESKMGYLDMQLMNRNIPHTFYNLDTTSKYLQTKIKPYSFTEDSHLFFQKTWVEENPTCPCKAHHPRLHMIPCEKVYKDRRVTFTGYQCELCKRIYVRRSKAFELEDECAELGIPKIRRFRVERKIPDKKPIPEKQFHPDYYVENGKSVKHRSEHNYKRFRLTEDDILVVSDIRSCMLDGHDTETVLVLIRVDEKKTEEINTYACEVGFCSDCNKYYIDEEDYRVLYRLGRPEVSVLIDMDDSNYHITSGTEFNLEKGHLKGVEDKLEGEVSKITSRSDYVSKYQTGDYDDGALRFLKQSAGKYDDTLEKLNRFIPKPFSYRVDIMSGDESETYYIGASDITLNGINYVISANSDFGHELVNYQTSTIKRRGKEYRLKLTRQFDISHATLYGYTNVRTDEDAIFKKGITDPFLIRVLNMRKKQHNLTDIFVTIQENQNKIVNAKFNQNLVVQGCAGSGKTMVLLHRLSSLCYKEKSFDFGTQALILTPNEHFTTHIKGLSEDLQIRYIDKLTVEQYYLRILLEYSGDFKLDGRISSEMNVRQDFVNYVYSDQFKKDFSKAYENVIARRNNLAIRLNQLADKINLLQKEYIFDKNEKVYEQLLSGIQTINGSIKLQEDRYLAASEDYKNTINRKQQLTEKAPELLDAWLRTRDEAIPRCFQKIEKYLSNHRMFLSRMEADRLKLIDGKAKGVKSRNEVEERRRRTDLLREIDAVEKRIETEKQRIERDSALLTLPGDEKSQEETFEWLRSISHIVPGVKEEVRACDRSQNEYKRTLDVLNSIDQMIETSKKEMDQSEKDRYSAQIREDAKALEESVQQYTLQNMFQMTFEKATEKYRKNNNVKNISGKYHRYDLYARLIFSQMFFDKKPDGVHFMCIDEGQDISENEYRLIRDLNETDTVFNIFGDINQLMKPGRGISNWAKLDKIIGTAKYSLNENYRNTNQITHFCNESFGMNVTQTGVDGANVRELRRADLESELSSLDMISERIALLVPRKVKSKKKYLDEKILADEAKNHIGDQIGNGYISLMYVDEVKGIEFDKAYVVPKGMTKSEKYIAYTRALSELVIVVDV